MGAFNTCAEWFATPMRVKILMIVSISIAGILFALSMWQLTFRDDNVTDEFGNNIDWEDFCNGEENGLNTVQYIRPFAFEWENNQDEGTSWCPWPVANTVYRSIISIFSLLFAAVYLFFSTPIDFLGPFFMSSFAFIYFSIFSLDANSLSIGNEICEDGFDDLLLDNLDSITCIPGMYVATLFFSIFAVCSFGMLGMAWARTGSIHGGAGAASPSGVNVQNK